MSLFGYDFGFDRLAVGMFTGLTYGLLAIGIVLVYRSSKFVNFAHGAIGVFGAAVLAKLTDGITFWLAFPIAILVAGALGAGIEMSVVRRLRGRPRVIGMIATLGLSQFILVLALLVDRDSFSGATYPKPPGLPAFSIGTTAVGSSLTAMLVLTPVLLAALAFFLRRTKYGIAIRAAADHPDAATVNGVPAPMMTSLAWAVAGGVAAFSAILLTPTQGVQSIESLGPQLLLRGLAGAVIARMASLPIAFVASIGVGVLEQVLLSKETSGFVDVVLGLAILVALLRQRSGGRNSEHAAWPRWDATSPPGARIGLALLAVVGVGLAYVVSNSTASILTMICGYALVGLSVILVTGIAGELSLGQFAFAGIGAAAAIQAAQASGNMLVGVAAGCAAGALASTLVGIPALRLRGVALGVTTLAFALATSGWLLRQSFLLGDGLTTPYPVWRDYVVSVSTDYYLFALLLLALGWMVTARLRRGGFGRLLLALRDNEEAGRALTVAAPVRKLQVYAVAGALAGLGGVVIGFGQSQLSINSFPASASIDVVAIAVVGGLSRTGGALLGSLVIVGLPALLPLGIPGQAVLTLGWLLVVIFLPEGLGGLLAGLLSRIPAGRVPADWLSRVRAWRPAQASAPGRIGPDGLIPGFPPETVHDPAPLSSVPALSGSAAAPHSLPDKSDLSGKAPGRPGQWRVHHLPAARLAPATGDGPLLEVAGIRRSFGGVRAVQDATFTITEGEIVGIIGPNGAGKTTLFEILAGFTGSDGGTVRYQGRAITGWTPERRARAGLVRSFQDARLFPAMSVREAVMVAAESAIPSSLVIDILGDERPEIAKAERALTALRAMGLEDLADKPVGELSTGTRRIVELCCLLTLEPRVLLLDEPSSGLTQSDGVALGELMLRVRDELGTTVLVIEHDLPLLSRVADRLIAMDAGAVIAAGPPDEVRSHPAVVLSYLGTDEAAVARSGEPAG
ncbi:ABC-type branched-subunit amino acid transport system ATPase component/ABC-type branched-subunit amino acid transport system permease subunit [Actinoplanes lutulentus]|uniref:ABC-type branched-subunit amino acid transport system ATPase component n=1 Tax=Actinoplanes lutulentus TaxID=1287878 RepID=A0A327ZHK4_9ACTN|nr:ATP-binding cassette domain-containing protein [Actinoplanes lutulentus]MBB2944416.1 ABC-type branched-subunit amino acid transport system ATPase component/ABC-type branched-subunit amino acid transport system permease subunit [Actinoplanes lutulentus]RAK42352.1 ABC-type branched-subunit amino acid transport system ATPase component [Actinoplanes lutulentus]